MIDTLKYSRQLEEAGFDSKQSELFVRSQMAMISENVLTKIDLREIEDKIKTVDNKVHVLTEKMESRFETMESRFELKLQRVTNRLAVIMITSMGVFSTVLGAFLKFF